MKVKCATFFSFIIFFLLVKDVYRPLFVDHALINYRLITVQEGLNTVLPIECLCVSNIGQTANNNDNLYIMVTMIYHK